MSATPQKSPRVIWIAQLLLLIAIGISAYLAYQALSGSQVAGCGAEESCGKVLKSKWSSVLTLPISLLGIVLYLSLLVLGFIGRLRACEGLVASTLAITIILGSLWFTGLQIFEIGSYCAYCCTIHLSASVASLVILRHLYGRPEERSPKGKKMGIKERQRRATQLAKKQEKGVKTEIVPSPQAEPKWHLLTATGIALIVVSITGFLQAYGPQKARSETVTMASPSGFADDGKTITSRPQPLFVPYRASADHPLQHSYSGGRYIIPEGSLQTLTIGERIEGKDPVLLTYLFDWACDHCRTLHEKMHNLSKQDRPYGIDEQYQITFLPASFETASETLHRVMLNTYHHDQEFYSILEHELYDKSLEAHYPPVLERVVGKYGEYEWSKLVARSGEQTQRAINLAALQVDHNRALLNTTTFPQLSSIRSVISGAPTDKSLAEFLQRASLEQKAYLTRPPQDPAPREVPTKVKSSTLDNPNQKNAGLPTRNNSKILFERAIQWSSKCQEGDIVRGTFHFQNTGTDPLEIYNLTTGCGCTYSLDWKQTVLPGQKGQITLQYNSSDKSPYGIHTRNAWVTSSASNYDKDKPQGVKMGNQISLKVPMVNEKGEFLLKDRSGKIFTKQKIAGYPN